jgi:hypothetical protein
VEMLGRGFAATADKRAASGPDHSDLRPDATVW